jgi:hypothetical protein
MGVAKHGKKAATLEIIAQAVFKIKQFVQELVVLPPKNPVYCLKKCRKCFVVTIFDACCGTFPSVASICFSVAVAFFAYFAQKNHHVFGASEEKCYKYFTFLGLYDRL